MPKEIHQTGEIQPGDIYEDSAYHPCLCLGTDNYEVWGISLIDGSYPRCEDIGLSGVRKLTVEEAWVWRISGPTDIDLENENRWWETVDTVKTHRRSPLEEEEYAESIGNLQ